MTSGSLSNLDQFVATIARLRAPNGCPWDLKQTHRTLARYLLEEAYEVLEAIHLDDSEKLKEELGDLLLQIVLNAQVASDAKQFTLEDVAQTINEKMIRRHPHVFGDTNLKTAIEVISQWQELKMKEKERKDQSCLTGIPTSMPALLQALKISEAAVSQGFEWEEEKDIWAQLESELSEFKAETKKIEEQKKDNKSIDLTDAHLEMGDILFTLVNIARWHDLNPEESLLMAIKKFKKRFQHMEKISTRPLKDLSFAELESLWRQAKVETK